MYSLLVPVIFQQFHRNSVPGKGKVSFQNKRFLFHDHVLFYASTKGQQVYGKFLIRVRFFRGVGHSNYGYFKMISLPFFFVTPLFSVISFFFGF